jgi:cobalt-zinc-cadmium resistance protein CzcA
VAGFIPLFTMSGVEGHIFGPMARTYAYAILGGLIATFTVTPALSSFLLPARLSEADTFVVRWMRKIYTPVVQFALENRIIALGVAGIIFVIAILAARGLGSEFLPHLEEGNLWIRASMPASISLQAGDSYVNKMRRIIKSYPEVETVVSQHGRPDDGTDATGFFNAEFFAPLKPADQWPSGVDKAKLVDDLTRRLANEFPGADFNFSQYIEDNVEEAASGVKGENSVKLYGNDLNVLQATAEKIDKVMEGVPGIADLAVFNSLGQPTVEVNVNRDMSARYGLATGDVNSVVQTAIGGQAAGNLYEDGSDRNFPIMVRLAPQYRASLDAIRSITVGVQNPAGNGIMQIPLSDLATVKLVSGASFIYRENQERYIPIKFSVRGRDLGGAVTDAQRQIAEKVKLPSGYRLEWVGEFGEFEEAIKRLALIVPLSILLIGFMLYINFGTLTDTLLAASVIPMTLVGGIFALVITGTAFSVSAAIGFVALFGIAAMDGIIVLSYFNRMVDEGRDKMTALHRTCEIQMRPVMMTCVVACVGLFPAAISTGIGSQVQKPLALVVVGGMLLAPVFILLVLPVLIEIFSRRDRTPPEDSASPMAAE